VRPVPRTPSNKLKTPSRGLLPASATPSTSKSPVKPKKVSPEQLRLEVYAQVLFDELNTAVFEGGLAETELVWNVRLLTTAGRAVRKKKGMALKLKIELSTKVVDSEGEFDALVTVPLINAELRYRTRQKHTLSRDVSHSRLGPRWRPA
jgi:hypothetical protein